MLSLATAGAGSAAFAEDGYRLGQGYDVGPFNFAGYANATAAAATNGSQTELAVDDLSLFVTGHINRTLNPFVEVEATSMDLVHAGVNWNGPRAVVERIYNDVQLSDALTLRGGKMLTPVGEWNQIHAAPLVWTTNRPIVTYRGFGEYTSGASLLFSDGHGLVPEVQAYWQPDREIVPGAGDDQTGRHYRDMAGVHLNWPVGLVDKLGASFQRSEVVGRGDVQYLYGINGKVGFGRVSVDGEATFSTIDGTEGYGRRTEWGGYVLGAYALTPEISAFAWYETFQARDEPGRARDVLVGFSYRPMPPLVWKLEYLKRFGNAESPPSGVYGSFAVLF